MFVCYIYIFFIKMIDWLEIDKFDKDGFFFIKI